MSLFALRDWYKVPLVIVLVITNLCKKTIICVVSPICR